MHDIFRSKFSQYFKMLISIKIIKLLSNLSCDITHSSFSLEPVFEYGSGFSLMHSRFNIHEVLTSKKQR